MTEPPTDALTLERLRADVAGVLALPAAEVGDDDDLIDLGLDSVRLMLLAERWKAAGSGVDFAALAEHTRLGAWWTLVMDARRAPDV